MIDIIQQNEVLVVTGELTLKTVTKSFEKKSYQLLTKQIKLLDFKAVSKVDTAGLAWLLMMIEHAKKQSQLIHFINTPNELIRLAKLSAVDTFLPTK
jgi:phospholipid transport system transporter-binding protein